MTLGEKLKNVMAAEEERKREAIRKEEERKARLRAEARYERMRTVHAIKNHIINQLDAGKVPLYKIRGTELKAWVNRVYERLADCIQDQDLWDELVAWLKQEGLLIKLDYGHDGMGTDDWLVVTVILIPGPEDEAD